jgi:hypothetical protein
MALNVGLYTSFHNTQDWERNQEAAEEVNSTKPYTSYQDNSAEFSVGVTLVIMRAICKR